MPLKSLFNGSKKRKLPPRKTKEKDVPSAPAKRKHLDAFWPHDDKDMQELYARDLVEWAKLETSMEIDDFFNEKNIGIMKFYDACKDNSFIDECHGLALSLIGARLRKKVEEENAYIYKMLPQYMSVFRLERKEKLAAENQIKNKEDLNYLLTVNQGCNGCSGKA